MKFEFTIKMPFEGTFNLNLPPHPSPSHNFFPSQLMEKLGPMMGGMGGGMPGAGMPGGGFGGAGGDDSDDDDMPDLDDLPDLE